MLNVILKLPFQTKNINIPGNFPAERVMQKLQTKRNIRLKTTKYE